MNNENHIEKGGDSMATAFEAHQKDWRGNPYKARSVAYSNLISGDWEFDGLDHQARISTIHTIINLMEGLMKTGWIEHTNDWDWRISVVHGEAKLVAGTYEGEDLVNYTDSSWTDTIRLNVTDETDWEKVTYLAVDEFQGDDGDPVEVLVPIADIRTITVEQA